MTGTPKYWLAEKTDHSANAVTFFCFTSLRKHKIDPNQTSLYKKKRYHEIMDSKEIPNRPLSRPDTKSTGVTEISNRGEK